MRAWDNNLDSSRLIIVGSLMRSVRDQSLRVNQAVIEIVVDCSRQALISVFLPLKMLCGFGEGRY